MEQKKDCSLLRPFDLVEAKAGNRIAWHINGDEGDLVAGPDIDGRICIDWEGKRRGDRGLVVCDAILEAKYLRIAPLCWVEGRPVYKGATLHYINQPDRDFTVHGITKNGTLTNERGHGENAACLTWTQPNPVLCEVEGKPVRKGDRLWSNYFKDWFTVSGKRVSIKDEEVSLISERGGDTLATSCSWKRKVKKQGFINIYQSDAHHSMIAVASTATTIYPNKGAADALAASNRLACVQVEWEEEASE